MTEVTPHYITGDWRHLVEDGMVDHDPLPDKVLPTGHVQFEPISPRVAVAGTPATAYTLGPDKALIADGVLTDMQGREGIWLTGQIGGSTVRWRATVHLEFRGEKIAYPTIDFDLTEDVRLTGLIQQTGPHTPFVIDPRIEDLAGRLADVDQVVSDAEQIVADAGQSVVDAGLQADRARDEADRAIGLAHAQDEHIAGTLEDETSETHAAFKRVGNATYGTKAEVAEKADAADLRLERTGASLWSMLAQPALGVTLERVSAAKYYLYSNLHGQRRIRWTLEETSNSRPGTVHQIRDVHAITVEDNGGVTTTVVDERDNPDITWSGTWSNTGLVTPVDGAHGGSFRRTVTDGAYAEWTSPPASAVGILGVQTFQGGIAKVTVDGSADKANLLPTAQDLVASGTLEASALESNGGTLNPDDRLINFYTYPITVYAWDVPIASGLDEAPHTVRVTATDYTHPEAVDQRVTIDAFTYGIATGGPVTVEEQLGGTGSVWEYALRIIAGGEALIIGNDHGYEYQTGLAFIVDGAVVELENGESVSGEEIIVTRTSQLSHPGIGLNPGDAGDAVCEWRLKGDAMSIGFEYTPTFNSHDWNNKIGGPLPSASTTDSKGFTRGRTLAMDDNLLLDAHDGSLHPSNPESPSGNGTPSDTAVFWQPEGHWALITHVPDIKKSYRDRWITTYIQDRATTPDRPDLRMVKGYFRQMNVAFEEGKPIRVQGVHRFVWLPNPDLTLAL